MAPINFTTQELTKTKIQVMDQGITPDSFDDTQLPTDVHIVQYTLDGVATFDVVRAYTMVDIFDVYYDKIKGQGEIKSIKSGYGRIKPKLYGKIKNEESWLHRAAEASSSQKSLQVNC